MTVKITRIASVENHPTLNHLSVYTLTDIPDIKLVSMKVDDDHRYQLGEYVAHIPPETIWPEWLLKYMDFWDEAKGKGTLGGSKGNRLKARTFARGTSEEVVSFGMLHRVSCEKGDFFIQTETGKKFIGGLSGPPINLDADYSEILGITQT